ncbi:MAG: hypothetical protein KBD78_02810 [Oligoflexales bacterium]|nr:hypothetical protein [Oligoflexales bacterium]
MNQKINKKRIDYWHQVFADLKLSGLTIADFCRKNNLSIKRAYHWHKRLGYSLEVKKKAITPKFIPIEIKQVYKTKYEIDPSLLAKYTLAIIRYQQL